MRGMISCSPVTKSRNALLLGAFAVLSLLILSSASIDGDAAESQGIFSGEIRYDHVDLHFDEGGRDQSLSIRLPGGGEILQQSLSLQTIPGMKGPGSVFVDIGLDNRLEWDFGGGNEGRFGEQVCFYNSKVSRIESGDGNPDSFSFYLPQGSDITDATIGVTAPPSPEGYSNQLVFDSPSNDIELDSVDTADINDDGNIELIFFDPDKGRIRISGKDAGGSTIDKVLLSNVNPPVHLRSLGRTDDHPSITVVSMGGEDGNQIINAFIGNEMDDLEFVTLSKDLTLGSAGFSLTEVDGKAQLFLINGTNLDLLRYDLKQDGSLSRSHLLDLPENYSSIVPADIDGDMDLDLLLFPPEGSGRNLTILKDSGPMDPSVYIFKATDLDISARDVGVAIDIDGDGDQEVVIGTGNDSHPAIYDLDNSGNMRSYWVGFNHTRSSPRVIPEAYAVNEEAPYLPNDVLYLTTFSGLYHIKAGSEDIDEMIWRRSSSFDSLPLVPGQQGSNKILSLRRDMKFIQQELIWSTASNIKILDQDLDEHQLVPVPFAGVGEIGLTEIVRSMVDLPVMRNEHHTYFERYDLNIKGDGGFIGLSNLSVEYDVLIDLSSSPGMDESMKSALRDLSGDWIPISIGASDRGSVRIGPSSVEYDSPPVVAESLPDRIYADEDSRGITHFNIRDHISDDYLLPRGLDVELVIMNDGPEDLLFMDRNGNIATQAFRYPDYYGEIDFYFKISDLRSTVSSPLIVLEVRSQQDPPVVVGDPGLILLDEGSSESIPLQGHGGIFRDPDGDQIQYQMDIIDVYPIRMMDHVDMNIQGGDLRISSDIKGTGGEVRLMIYAKDLKMEWDQASSTILGIKFNDIDAPPERGENPGKVFLMEDQSTPYRVPLGGWLFDPDTRYEDYQFTLHSSNPYLDTFISNYNGEKNLFITPTNDLTGEHFILIEMWNEENSILDRIDVVIEPVNDIPFISFDSKRLLENRGWHVTGHVDDKDSYDGIVEYRIGEGEWMPAWGFKSWSCVIDFEDAPGDKVFVFFRANDGLETSPLVYVKLERPEVIPDPPIDPIDVDDDRDDPIIDDNDPFIDSDGLVPDPSNDGQPPWLVLGGIGGIIAGVIIFFGWTEIGMIVLATIGASIYSKLSKKDILNHEIRGLIRGYIIANPGDHYSSIKRNLDLNNGTLAYHLRVLEQNGFIKSMYDGIYKRYYPSNVNISKLKKNVSKQEEIFNIILENPGVTMEEIGRMIGVSRQVVNYHVKNLIRAGVVDYRRDKKSAKFYSSDNGTNIFDQET